MGLSDLLNQAKKHCEQLGVPQDVELFWDRHRLHVRSPFDLDFISKVKALGGRWDSSEKTWSVAPERKSRLRELLRSVYGTDGSPERLVRLRFKVGYWLENGNEIRLAGRSILRRPGRDWSVKIYPYYDMAVVEGDLPGRGGSRKNPRIDLEDAVVMEALGIPAGVAEKIIADGAETVEF